MAARPPKIRYTHDGVIDMIIAEPQISQNEIAARFGYTPSWISTVMTSDAFKARLAERKSEIVDPVLRMNMEERFRAVTERSLAVLMEKLTQPASSVPDALALQAANLGAKSLGFGVPQTQVNVGIDLRGALEEAQARREARYGGLALVGAPG
jgi:hypothetical protein